MRVGLAAVARATTAQARGELWSDFCAGPTNTTFPGLAERNTLPRPDIEASANLSDRCRYFVVEGTEIIVRSAVGVYPWIPMRSGRPSSSSESCAAVGPRVVVDVEDDDTT